MVYVLSVAVLLVFSTVSKEFELWVGHRVNTLMQFVQALFGEYRGAIFPVGPLDPLSLQLPLFLFPLQLTCRFNLYTELTQQRLWRLLQSTFANSFKVCWPEYISIDFLHLFEVVHFVIIFLLLFLVNYDKTWLGVLISRDGKFPVLRGFLGVKWKSQSCKIPNGRLASTCLADFAEYVALITTCLPIRFHGLS